MCIRDRVIVDLVISLIPQEAYDELLPNGDQEFFAIPLVELINWYPISQTTDLHRHSYKWFVAGVKDLGEGDGLPDDRIPEENELVIAGNRWPFLFFNFDHLDLPGLTTGQEVTMAEYMTQGLATQHFPDEMANVQEFITNMNLLAQLSTQELESLMVEHIDTCSHRLDTWLLSLVNKRVEKLRDGNTNNKGLHIGAFGWVLDLKPGQTRTDLSGSPIVYNADTDGSEVPIANDPDNQGFIHAPSLNHAVTAAVLKAGYNATGRNELLEVNLSSARVRKAMFYIEGVRNGQNLGALLGYQFERGLHDNNSEELDQYILEMRKAFPLVADILLDSKASESIETIQANQVIDGLKLLEHMRETPYPYGIHTLPSASSPEGLAIIAEVKNMEGDLDAVGDLALAEGVYQVTQGNYTRSNAMMKAVSEGSFIPQPEIINTPRTGQNLTHRSIISMTPVSDGTKPALWPAALRGRTKAENTANNWLAEILGDPRSIRCLVYVTKGSAPDNPLVKAVNVKQIGLQALDLMYAMNADFKGSQSLLFNRIAGKAISSIGLEEGEEILNIEIRWEAQGSNWGNIGVKTFIEILPLIQNAYKLLSGSRYLRADDLVHPSFDTEDMENPYGIDLDGLIVRVQSMRTDVNFIRNTINIRISNVQNNYSDAWFGQLANWINVAANLGIQEAVVLPISKNMINEEYAVTLVEQAQKVIAVLEERIAVYDAELTRLNNTELTPLERVDLLTELSQILMGKEFRMLPIFELLNPTEIQNAHTNQVNIIPQEPLAMERWLSGISRVREKMWTLENVMLLTTLMESKLHATQTDDYEKDNQELSALQLPFRANDHWVGLEIPEDYFASHENDPVEVSRDKLSLVGWLNPEFNTQTTFAGILVDEWNELIPNKEETTGIAFHYDQPNARPPQTVLLGIHPKNSDDSPWAWNHLVDTLHCTLDLAKVRAVEPDHLLVKEHDPSFSFFDAFAHILPGIVSRVGPNDPDVDTVFSVDFNENINQPLFEYHTPDPQGPGGPAEPNPQVPIKGK